MMLGIKWVKQDKMYRRKNFDRKSYKDKVKVCWKYILNTSSAG